MLPSLIRTGGQLIGISTPYRKLGLLFQKHKDYFGVDDPTVLVVQGDSRVFNPTLSERDIVQAMASDPEAGISEWEGRFRADIAAFLSDADIEACVDYDRPRELPPRSGITYQAFTDPSGGRHDTFALCIGHKDGEVHYHRRGVRSAAAVRPQGDDRGIRAPAERISHHVGDG